MRLLEERYRRVLRLLPADYRSAWEPDMVATFLDSAYAGARDEDEIEEIGLGRPRLAEVASVAVLALRVRLGAAGGSPRAAAWGEAVRRFALAGLLMHAISALFGLVSTVWLAGRYQPPLTIAAQATSAMPPWPLLLAQNLMGLLWVAALGCLVAGRRRTGCLLAAAAAAALLVYDLAQAGASAGVSVTQWLVAGLVPVLALVGFHREAAPPARRQWLVAGVIGVALYAAFQVAMTAVGPAVPNAVAVAAIDGVWIAGWLVAVVIFLFAPLAAGRRRDPRWSVALGLTAAWLLARPAVEFATGVRPIFAAGSPIWLKAVWAGALVGLLLTALTLTAIGRRSLRAVPDTPAVHDSP